MFKREDATRARGDLAAFAALVAYPLTATQVAALALEARTTVIVAPRQTGKSRSLAVLSTWWAYRKRQQRVLIVSAGESAAARLLAEIRTICGHPLLAGAVVDENNSLVTLSNGSTIRSVPASERQVRGWSIDLLIVDEAAFVDEDLLHGAAIPTTAARPDARIVLASSPWANAGPFFEFARQGLSGSGLVRTFRWSLVDAPWITAEVVESARASMSEARFRAEFDAEFVAASDAFFDPDDLRAAVASFVSPESLPGGVVGLDWGRQFDAHAVVVAAQLQDYGRNSAPVVFVPWVETSRRPYADQVGTVADLVGRLGVGWVCSETNGVGAYPSEDLTSRLGGRAVVERVASSQRSKEDAYGRLRSLLSARRLVLPDDPELLRQLGGIIAEPTAGGGLSIRAASPALHDDLPDALSLAVSRVQTREGVVVPEREGVVWTATAGGVALPVAPVGGPARRRGPVMTFAGVQGPDLPPAPATFGASWPEKWAPQRVVPRTGFRLDAETPQALHHRVVERPPG